MNYSDSQKLGRLKYILEPSGLLQYWGILVTKKTKKRRMYPQYLKFVFGFFGWNPPPLPIYCTEQKFECDGYLHFIINQAISILVEWVTVYNHFFLKSAKWPLALGMHIYSTKRSDFF